MLLAAMGAAVFALAQSLAVATAGRLLTGRVVFVSVQKPDLLVPAAEFATITGLTSTVGNTGAILAATPLAFLVAAIGWRNSSWWWPCWD